MGYVFGDQLDYVRELTPLFWLSLFLFASCLAYGYYSGSTLGLEVLEEKLETMPDLEGQSLPVVILVYFFFIFFSNVLVGLMSIVSGLIFGIPALMINAMNGYYSGGIIRNSSMEMGLPFTLSILLPHGIIEIPTFVLCWAVGLSLGYKLLGTIKGGGGLRSEFGRAIRLYVTRLIPLLLLAACIEVVITPFFGLLFSPI